MQEEIGRVTRSLRKRIASIDQDVSSRPGTPTNTPNTSISTRLTRRNSTTSTDKIGSPKKTPLNTKTGVILEVDSPARRTRRRSVSINLDDPIAKVFTNPVFETVLEENIIETRRVTRLQSKSPSLSTSPSPKSSVKRSIISGKEIGNRLNAKLKAGGPKKIESNDCDFENVEVIDIDSDNEVVIENDTRKKNDNKTPLGLLISEEIEIIPKSPKLVEMVEKKENEEKIDKNEENKYVGNKNTGSVPIRTVGFMSSPETNKLKQRYPKTPAVLTKSKSYIEGDLTHSDSNEDTDVSLKELTGNEDVLPETQMESELKQDEFQGDLTHSNSNEETDVSLKELTGNENVLPETQIEGELKLDEFQNKNLIQIESDEKLVVQSEKTIEVKTPFRHSFKRCSLQSSTPLIETQTRDRNDNLNKQDLKQGMKNVPNENSFDDASNENSFEKKIADEPVFVKDDIKLGKAWSQSVSGKVTDNLQLDKIQQEQYIFKSENESLKLISPKRTRKSLELSCDDIIDQQNSREFTNDEVEDSDDDDEEPYKKHSFIDDEAMEVETYKSCDSMDSEERRENEENEIPVDGESLGSADTENESDEDEDDGDGGSFIVSDKSEDLLEYSDIDEHIADSIDKKIAKYKRIQLFDSDTNDEITKLEKETKPKVDKDEKNNNSYIKKDEKLHVSKNIEDNSTKCISGQELNKSEQNLSKLSDSALRLQYNEDPTADEDEGEVSLKLLSNLNESDHLNQTVQDLDMEIDDKSVGEKVDETDENVVQEPMENSLKTNSKLLNISENFSKKSHSPKKKSLSFTSTIIQETKIRSELYNNNSFTSGYGPTASKLHLAKNIENVEKGNEPTKEDKNEMNSDIELEKNTEINEEIANENKESDQNICMESSDEEQITRKEFVAEEVERLKKIETVSRYLANERRKSLAIPITTSINDDYSDVNKKKLKRKSFGSALDDMNDFNPSRSLIETIEECRQDLCRKDVKKKRLSKSFSGVLESEVENYESNDDLPTCGLNDTILDGEDTHPHKKSKFSETTDSSPPNCNAPPVTVTNIVEKVKISKDNGKNHLQKILTRCDDILEQANSAKLAAIIQKKQNTLKKKSNKNNKKKKNKLEKEMSCEAQKEIKRMAIEKAFKTAANILVEHSTVEETPINNISENIETKKLPIEFLKTLESKNEKKKKIKKDVHMINKSDVEEQIQVCQDSAPKHKNKNSDSNVISNAAGEVTESAVTPQKKAKIRKIAIPSGIMLEEPITPTRSLYKQKDGFRESPITPKTVTYKVRHMLAFGQDMAPRVELSAIQKNGKRKRVHLEDPKRSLPQPLWTKSGIFVEREAYVPKTLIKTSHTTTTEFSISGLKTKTKRNDNAINFKNLALSQNKSIPRESIRKLLQRKERAAANRYF